MPARLTLYPTEGVSRHFVLREGEQYALGRETTSDVLLDDPRISARHARLLSRGPEWRVLDLHSKNGTFVNAVRVTEASLESADWISFGGFLTRFEIVSESQVENLRSERSRRLQTFSEARRILDSTREPPSVLSRLVGSVLELTGAERGFLLLFGQDGELRAEIAAGFGDSPTQRGGFASDGAIERALATGRPVVASNARADAYLGKRPSVLEMGIQTLACVPLRSGEMTVGLLYVDGKKRGGSFTDLDLEILEALSEYAAVAAAGLRLDRQIRELVGAPAPGAASRAPFLEDLERRVGAIVRGSAARSAQP